MKEKLNLAVIYGSAREGRFCDIVANWLLSHLEDDDTLSIDILDPAVIDLPARHTGDSLPVVHKLRAAIGESDAFIVITPEYNHSFTGELKLLIDAAKTEWKNKALAFVSYGGISGGLRAVEQLRPVFAELHVTTLRETVSFAHAHKAFGPDGMPLDPINTKAALMRQIKDLKWWAHALREARHPAPLEFA